MRSICRLSTCFWLDYRWLIRTLVLLLLLSVRIIKSQQQHLSGALMPLRQLGQQQQLISTMQSIAKSNQPQRQSSVGLKSGELQAVPADQRHVGLSQGPGVDLVALNWRRFEMEHKHHAEHTTGEELKRGQMIESQMAAIPERLLSQLPEEISRQVIESLSADPSLVLAPPTDSAEAIASLAASQLSEDPDGASIERLTKSCLTVQASSLTADQLNVTFYLYTRRNPERAFIVRPQATRLELLQSSIFDPTKSIKWITHGFHTNVDKSEWMLEAKDKILANEDANVFLTDWRRGASPALAFYPKAAANAHVVARMIVRILRRIWADIKLSEVHLIGHSLGAHIMGFVGSAFTEEFLRRQQKALADGGGGGQGEPPTLNPSSIGNQLIGRITACDPALPCFGPSSRGPNSKMSGSLTMDRTRWARPRPGQGGDLLQNLRFKRQPGPARAASLDGSQAMLGAGILTEEWTPTMWTHLRPDSAILVEVMHSNPGVMGYAEPLGDFDFYPNGSERQPGCSGAETGDSEARSQLTPTARKMGFDPPILRIDSRYVRKLTNELVKRQIGSAGPLLQARNKRQVSWPTGGRANGGGFVKTIGNFMKPIRDFFHAYTCSHHRSVEYMVESMYYEQVEPSGRLDSQLVCQMVGYNCANYKSFKRGHCFMCRNEFECRPFARLTKTTGSSERFQLAQQPLAAHFARDDLASLKSEGHSGTSTARVSSSRRQMERLLRYKRILPTLSQYKQNYKAAQRNQYYFDTKSTRNYCLNHYHFRVKYRWLRIRNSVSVERLRLSGTLGAYLSRHPVTFHKYTQHSYTMLLTHADLLGQLETLLLFDVDGDQLKTQYIEYIDISYLSNIDPLVRDVNSARMCRANQTGPHQGQLNSELARLLGIDDEGSQLATTGIVLFVRCPQESRLVR